MGPIRWRILSLPAMAAAARLSTIRRCRRPTRRHPAHQRRPRLAMAKRSTLGAAFSGSVNFDGPAGKLVLDSTSSGQPAAATVSGFGAQDEIDLSDIAFGAHTTLGYSPNGNQTGGTLTVGDGSHVANIALLGSYIASSFAIAGDSNGGTMVSAETQSANQSLLTHPQHA